MPKFRIPHPGDVYAIEPNPTSGREMKDKHLFVVITPKEINALGVSIAVAITSGRGFARNMGIVVNITGHDTSGVAVCTQVRSFDIDARIKAGTAKYLETLSPSITNEIIARVVSIIDPEI